VTKERRPDLLDATKLIDEDLRILEEIEQEEADE
jgi:hypothetical protein